MAKPLASKIKLFVFWLRTHKLVSVALVLILLVVGFFVYEKVALELNKRAFQNARTAIDAVYADIVKNVGQPDNFKRSSDCSKLSRTFGDGPIVCDVRTSFIYGLNNENDPNGLLKKIQTAISSHKKTFKTSGPLSVSIGSVNVGLKIYQDAEDIYKISGLDCSVKYAYDTPQEIHLELIHPAPHKFYISIRCPNIARAEYYPEV